MEYNKDAGIRTDQVHQYPKRPFFSSNGGTGTGTGSSSTIAATTAGTEATTAPTKDDRILNMLNGITIKLDRLVAFPISMNDLKAENACLYDLLRENEKWMKKKERV